MMKRAALAIVLASVAVACGSSDNDGNGGLGGAPDFTQVNARFDHPDGTLSNDNIGSVLSSKQSASNADLGVGGTSGSASSQSIRFLDNDVTGSCAAFRNGQQSGSCACPNGGSFDYEIQAAGGQGNGQSTMSFHLNACAMDKAVANGTEYIHAETTGSGAATQYSMLIVVDVSVTADGKTENVNLQERFSNGKFELAAKVDDGWVSVSYGYDQASGNSTITIKDKNGTWSCAGNSQSYTCSGSNGQTLNWKQ